MHKDVFVLVHGMGLQDGPWGKYGKNVAALKTSFATVLSETGRSLAEFEFLPVEWHSKVHQDSVDSRMSRVTLPTVPLMRTINNEYLSDILLYFTPHYRSKITKIVIDGCNEAVEGFRARHPDISCRFHIIAHSLGGIITFDILTQRESPRRLTFQPENLFCIGCPIGGTVVIRGEQISAETLQMGTRFYNCFHPYDPLAYRFDPLFNPEFEAHYPPQAIPPFVSTKPGVLYSGLSTVGSSMSRAIEYVKLPETWSWRSDGGSRSGTAENLLDELTDDEDAGGGSGSGERGGEGCGVSVTSPLGSGEKGTGEKKTLLSPSARAGTRASMPSGFTKLKRRAANSPISPINSRPGALGTDDAEMRTPKIALESLALEASMELDALAGALPGAVQQPDITVAPALLADAIGESGAEVVADESPQELSEQSVVAQTATWTFFSSFADTVYSLTGWGKSRDRISETVPERDEMNGDAAAAAGAGGFGHSVRGATRCPPSERRTDWVLPDVGVKGAREYILGLSSHFSYWSSLELAAFCIERCEK